MPTTYNASDYASWQLSLAGAVSAGAQSVQLSSGSVTIEGRRVSPLAAGAPCLIDNLTLAETVSPTSLQNPGGTGHPPTFMLATFASAHSAGALVRSSTFGLQEAVNDANNNGGGLVIIDDTWTGPAGASVIALIAGSSDVAIQDNRAGNSLLYTWNGVAYVNSQTLVDTTYAGTASYQPVAADLTLGAAAGKNAPDSAFLAPIMGNLHGDALTKTGTMLGGVIGEDSVTGAQATQFVKGGVVGIVADGVSASDGPVVALLDGDSGGVTTPGAMFKAKKLNSTPGNNPQYGLDLYSHESGFLPLAPTKGDIRMSSGVIMGSATATLTANQLKNLLATPVQMVAAPGSGKYILPTALSMVYHAGATPYTVADGELLLTPQGTAAGNISWNFFDGTGAGFLDQPDDQLYASTIMDINNGSPHKPPSLYDNKALMMARNGATEWTNGDGTVVVIVNYIVVPLS